LDVKLTIFRGGPELLSVMLTGEVDVGTTAVTEALTSAEAGSGIKMFWPVTNRASVVVMSKSEYRTANDLKGKSFAVSAYGGLYHFAIEHVMAAKGFDTRRDIKYVQVGAQVVEALETGAVDAAPMGAVAGTMLEEKGFVNQGNMKDYLPEYPAQAYMAPVKRINEKEEAFRRLNQATQKAAIWFRDPANKERAIQILVDVLKLTPETARANYESDYALDAFPTKAVWPIPGLIASIDFAINQQRLTNRVSPDDLIDYRFTGK
jgi:NitT/TauT family transport system substrate-binding protein